MLTPQEVAELAQKHGLPPEIALAIYSQESASGTNTKTSPKGAKGGFQVTQNTFDALMPGGDITDPKQNAEAGIKYLAEGYKKTGTVEGTAGYYHAGPQFASKLQSNPNLNDGFIKTTDYMKQIAAKATEFAQKITGAKSTQTAPAASTDADAVDAVLGNTGSQFDSEIKMLTGMGDSLLQDIFSANLDLSHKIKSGLEDEITRVRRSGEDNATIALERFRRDKERTAVNAANISRLGVNSDDHNSLAVSITENIRQRYEQAQQLRQKIADKQSVGIFDDPFQWIANQFTIDGDINQYNALAGQINADASYLATAQQAAANLSAADALKRANISEEEAKAAAQLARDLAEGKARELELRRDSTDLETQVKNLTIINQRVTQLRQLEELEGRKEVRLSVAADKARKQEMAQAENESVRIASQVLGFDIPDAKALKLQPKPVQEAVAAVRAGGADGAVFGKDTLQAVEILSRGVPGKMSPALEKMRSIVGGIAKSEEDKIGKDPIKQRLPKEQRRAEINAAVQARMAELQANPTIPIGRDGAPTGDDYSGMFAIPNPTVMGAIPGVKNLEITKLMNEYQKLNPRLPMTSSTLVESMAQAVMNGRIGDVANFNVADAAKQLALYTQAGMDYNNKIFQFDAMHLDKQTRYLYKGNDISSIEGAAKAILSVVKRKYDPMDPTRDFQNPLWGTANNVPGA